MFLLNPSHPRRDQIIDTPLPLPFSSKLNRTEIDKPSFSKVPQALYSDALPRVTLLSHISPYSTSVTLMGASFLRYYYCLLSWNRQFSVSSLNKCFGFPFHFDIKLLSRLDTQRNTRQVLVYHDFFRRHDLDIIVKTVHHPWLRIQTVAPPRDRPFNVFNWPSNTLENGVFLYPSSHQPFPNKYQPPLVLRTKFLTQRGQETLS